jgi:hypothetical protein
MFASAHRRPEIPAVKKLLACGERVGIERYFRRMKSFEGMIPVYPVCKQSAQALPPSFFFRYEQERTKTHRKND